MTQTQIVDTSGFTATAGSRIVNNRELEEALLRLEDEAARSPETRSEVRQAPSPGPASPWVPLDLQVRQAPHPSPGGSWHLVNSDGETASEYSRTSSEPDQDVAWHLRQMSVPDATRLARRLCAAGYTDMESVTSMDLDAVAQELSIPSGVVSILRTGIEHWKAGTFDHAYPMPLGDLDGQAPQPVPTFWENHKWKIIVGGSIAGVALGGLGMLALRGAGAIALAGGEAAGAGAGGVAGGVAAAAGTMAMTVDCLDATAEIEMSDRTRKKIKHLKAGDKILTYNKGKTLVKAVLEVKQSKSSDVYTLTLKKADGHTFTIKATGGHPFFTKDCGWCVIDPKKVAFAPGAKVEPLKQGAKLVTRKDGLVEIVDIVAPSSSAIATYNLVVDGPSTFFVHGILSHSGLPPAHTKTPQSKSKSKSTTSSSA